MVISAAPQKNLAVRDFGKVTGLKNAAAQRRFRRRPVGLARRAASHPQRAIGADLHLHIFQGTPHAGFIRARCVGRIIGNTAALGGTIKIMDLHAVLFKDGALQ